MKYSILAIFCFLFLIESNQAQIKNPSENTLLWEVTENGLEKPSYLYGTFHIMCKEDIHLSPALKKVVADVDTVYMELKLDDPMAMMESMQYMMMSGGKKLSDFYNKENYEKLSRFFTDSLKTNIALFQGMKPFFLISLLYPYLSHCKSPSGIEGEIQVLAKNDHKPIAGLETMKFQASLFDSIPYQKQADMLLKSVDSLKKTDEQLQAMIQLYKSQNLNGIDSMMQNQDTSDIQMGDEFIADRNANWVMQLNTIMKNGSVLVAVGAGHLPGNKGLISMLRKAGYEVKPLKN